MIATYMHRRFTGMGFTHSAFTLFPDHMHIESSVPFGNHTVNRVELASLKPEPDTTRGHMGPARDWITIFVIMIVAAGGIVWHVRT